MFICKVQGKCVSTIKNPAMTGASLITVKKLSGNGIAEGELMVAVDTIGSSVGETVIVASGQGARLALKNHEAPVDLAVIGLVDYCDFEE